MSKGIPRVIGAYFFICTKHNKRRRFGSRLAVALCYLMIDFRPSVQLDYIMIP